MSAGLGPESGPESGSARTASSPFDCAWRLHPQVALRDEPFGALAYHYGNRRLVFLKSRPLVELVRSLHEYPSAGAAVDAMVPAAERGSYRRALTRLADSGLLHVA